MKLLVLASLVIASTAYAQAPGDYDGQGYGGGAIAPPGMVPEAAPEFVPPAPPRLRRFSIGLGIGHASLAPHSAPDQTTEFDVGQIALRYLVRRHFEIELALTGGSEQNKDGSQGSRELSQAVLAVRYRFSPERRWNWWLMAGMGSLAVTNVYATKDERDAAMQSTLQFGIGMERRWSRFAIQGELRAVGVAKNEGMGDQPVKVDVPTNSMDPYPPYIGPSADDGGKKGGQFAITANYYF